mgnify:CR=1 FL=1
MVAAIMAGRRVVSGFGHAFLIWTLIRACPEINLTGNIRLGQCGPKPLSVSNLHFAKARLPARTAHRRVRLPISNPFVAHAVDKRSPHHPQRPELF